MEVKQKYVFVAGLPKPEYGLDKFRADGGKIIFFLTPPEAADFACRQGDQAFLWESDAGVKAHFVDHINKYVGAMIADTGSASQRLAALLGQAADLTNFDVHSMNVLGVKNEPLRNALQNYRWVQDGIQLRQLKGLGKDAGACAIVVAAGPSLDSQWAELRRIREAKTPLTTFLAVGRVYRKCVYEGIMPDFVVEAEQYEFDQALWNFAPMPSPNTILACPLQVYPGVMRGWPGEKLVLLDHTTAQVQGLQPGMDSIDGGNSVAHVALNLAVHLGCNPIALAGVDLGYPYPESDTHASGAFPESWPAQVLRTEHTRQNPVMAQGNDGLPLQSSPGYHNFGTLFETLIHKHRQANKSLKVFSFSPRGLKMLGVEYMPVKEWGKWNTSPSSSSVPARSSEGSLSVVTLPSSSPIGSAETPPSPIKKACKKPKPSTEKNSNGAESKPTPTPPTRLRRTRKTGNSALKNPS